MPDETITPEPTHEPRPTPTEAPEVPPPRIRTQPRARDIGLAAIVFAATLILLLGTTGLLQRGPFSGRSTSPGPASSPTQASAGESSGGSLATPGGSPGAAPSVGASAGLPGDPVLVGAGDIGDCETSGDEETAKLLDAIPGTVFTAGDNAYEEGTADQFRDCYHPNWGRHRDRTRPAPGNHDWETPGLAGYREYFGDAALGPGGTSWYSYELGTWHVIVLDSECDDVGGCGPSSPQGEWLAADLAAAEARCTIAIFHVPRFSSGERHGNESEMDAFWRPLFAAGVDVIANGHDHVYERFAPQDPDGREDRDRGIRQFVVGTGGAPLRGFGPPAANSELRSEGFYGVLAFTLRDGSYDWLFTAAGSTFRDRGTSSCH